MEVVSTQREMPSQQKKVVYLDLHLAVGLSATTSQSLAYSPVSHGLVAYPAGVHLVLYDVPSQKQRKLLQAVHAAVHHPISSAAFSKNGQFVAAGQKGQSPAVLVWEVESGQCLQAMKAHKVGVASLAWSPDGKYLVSAGLEHDGYVCVWDWTSGSLLCKQYTQSCLEAVTFSEDSSVVSVGKEHFKVWGLGGADGSSRLAAAGTNTISLVPKKPASLKDHRTATFVGVCACPTPTSSGVATTGVYALTATGWLILMRAASRTMDKSVDLQVCAAYGLDVSSTQVACACASGIVRIFAVRSLQCKGSLPRPAMKSQQGWAPANASTAVGHQLQAKLNTTPGDLFPDAVGCCFSPSGTQLTVVYEDQSLFVWDISDLNAVTRLHQLTGHHCGIWDMALIPAPMMEPAAAKAAAAAATHLATCSEDGTIRVWTLAPRQDSSDTAGLNFLGALGAQPAGSAQPKAGHCRYDFDTSLPQPGGSSSGGLESSVVLRCLAVNPHLMQLSAGDHLGRLHVYDLHTMNLLVSKAAHEAEVLCLDYSTCSQEGACLLASGARDMCVHVYDAREDYRHVATYDDHCAGVTAVRFCMGGNRLVSCGMDRNIIFRNLTSAGRDSAATYKIEHVPKCSMQDLLVDPMDRHALTVGQDNLVRVWDIASGQLLRTMQCDPHSGEILRLAMDPGGSILACCNSEGGVQLFDYSSSQLMATCTGHGDRVTAASVLPHCRGLVTVSQDGCILVWQLPPSLTQQMQKAAAMKSKKMLNVRQKLTRAAPEDSDGVLARVAQGKPLLQSEQLPKWAQSSPALSKAEPSQLPEGAAPTPSSRWAVNVGQHVTIHSEVATPATFRIGQRMPVQPFTPTAASSTICSNEDTTDAMDEGPEAALLASVNFSYADLQFGIKSSKPPAANGSGLHGLENAVSDIPALSGVPEAATTNADAQTDSPVAGLQTSSLAAHLPSLPPFHTPLKSDSTEGLSERENTIKDEGLDDGVEMASASKVPATHVASGIGHEREQPEVPTVRVAQQTHSEDDEVQYYECSVVDDDDLTLAVEGNRDDAEASGQDDTGTDFLAVSVEHLQRQHVLLEKDTDGHPLKTAASSTPDSNITTKCKAGDAPAQARRQKSPNTDAQPRDQDPFTPPSTSQCDPTPPTSFGRANTINSQSAVPSSTNSGANCMSPAAEDLPLPRVRSTIGDNNRPSRMHADLARMRERLQGLTRDFHQQENTRSASKRSNTHGPNTDAIHIASPAQCLPSPSSPTSAPKSLPILAVATSNVDTPQDWPRQQPWRGPTPMDVEAADSPASVSTQMTAQSGGGRDSLDFTNAIVQSTARRATLSPPPCARSPSAAGVQESLEDKPFSGSLHSNIHLRQLFLPAIKSAPHPSSLTSHPSLPPPAPSTPIHNPANYAAALVSTESDPTEATTPTLASPPMPTTGRSPSRQSPHTLSPTSRSPISKSPARTPTRSPARSPARSPTRTPARSLARSPARSPPGTPAAVSPFSSRSCTPPATRSSPMVLDLRVSLSARRSSDSLFSHPVELGHATEDNPPAAVHSTPAVAVTTVGTVQQHDGHVSPQVHVSPPSYMPQSTSAMHNADLAGPERDNADWTTASPGSVASPHGSPPPQQTQSPGARKQCPNQGSQTGSALNSKASRSRIALPSGNKKHAAVVGVNKRQEQQNTKAMEPRDSTISLGDGEGCGPYMTGTSPLLQGPNVLAGSVGRLSSLRASFPGHLPSSTEAGGLPQTVNMYEAALERFRTAATEVLSKWQELQCLDTSRVTDLEALPHSSPLAATLKLQTSYRQVLEETLAALQHHLPPNTPSGIGLAPSNQPHGMMMSPGHGNFMSPSAQAVSTHRNTAGSQWADQTERIAELVAQRLEQKQAAILQELVAKQVQQHFSSKGLTKRYDGTNNRLQKQ